MTVEEQSRQAAGQIITDASGRQWKIHSFRSMPSDELKAELADAPVDQGPICIPVVEGIYEPVSKPN